MRSSSEPLTRRERHSKLYSPPFWSAAARRRFGPVSPCHSTGSQAVSPAKRFRARERRPKRCQARPGAALACFSLPTQPGVKLFRLRSDFEPGNVGQSAARPGPAPLWPRFSLPTQPGVKLFRLRSDFEPGNVGRSTARPGPAPLLPCFSLPTQPGVKLFRLRSDFEPGNVGQSAARPGPAPLWPCFSLPTQPGVKLFRLRSDFEPGNVGQSAARPAHSKFVLLSSPSSNLRVIPSYLKLETRTFFKSPNPQSPIQNQKSKIPLFASSTIKRQIDRDSGAFSRLALNSHITTVLFHDLLHNREPKPRTSLLCRKEGLEDTVQGCLLDSLTPIRDQNARETP